MITNGILHAIILHAITTYLSYTIPLKRQEIIQKMAKKFSKSFYDSSRWKRCRAAYIDYRVSVDGGMCECCKQRLGYIVHHKIELNERNINDDSITLGFDNLEYDCKYCHDRKDNHFINPKSERKVLLQFDESGKVIPPVKDDRV